MAKKATPAEVQEPTQEQAGINILAQYVKDFSFENPNAPKSIVKGPGTAPELDIQVNVGARPIAQNDYEVDLKIEAKAKSTDGVIFNLELVYSGLFRLMNIPQESIQPVVLIEAPRILFPFARQIVSDITRNGGYPPLMIDPIDFAALFRQNLTAQQAAE